MQVASPLYLLPITRTSSFKDFVLSTNTKALKGKRADAGSIEAYEH